MNVLLTTDVELWPRAWDLSAREMDRAFGQFITGQTSRGDYGLEFQLAMLREHGLRGVFFVEPLFASVMGHGALGEIVEMIKAYEQEVQLHMHTEWLGRSVELSAFGHPRMSMSELDEVSQAELLGLGRQWLEDAGAPSICAFRAGSFGADRRTLRALGTTGIRIDSSHNPAGARGPLIEGLSDEPTTLEGVLEIPQTVYRNGFGRLRHAQVGSSSVGEIGSVLESAQAHGRKAFVILSHSAELLTGDRRRRDAVVVRRFERLCRLLADRESRWPTSGFTRLRAKDVVSDRQCDTITVNGWNTVLRYVEQALRRIV